MKWFLFLFAVSVAGCAFMPNDTAPKAAVSNGTDSKGAHAKNSVDEVVAQPTTLSGGEQKLVDWVAEQEKSMLRDLKKHVEINTGTLNHGGLDRYRGMLERELRRLGFRTRTVPGGEMSVLTCRGGEVKFARHLVAEHRGRGARIFLNGHMDTVFSKGDEFQKLKIEPGGVLKGPGVMDMKGGLIVMIYALRALKVAGRLKGANLTVFLNTDEEMGSLGSRPVIEKLAAQHDVGFIFEGSVKNRMVRARKGLGQVRLKVTGRESHAGASHAAGVSANLELAHKVIHLEKLTDYDEGVTVNVGVVEGGEKRNTRPGCAEAFVDLRYPDNEKGQRLKKSVEAIALTKYTHHPKFQSLPASEVWTRLHRPAKPIEAKTDALISEVMGLSQALGDEITGTYYSGGGTDGSIAQSVGLPTIDSLGLDGQGAHSSREWTTVKSLMARTKLFAVLLDRWIHTPRSFK